MPEAETGPPKPKPPPPALAWWEGLAVWQQLAIAAPVLSLLLFWINLAIFQQAALRSVAYGLFEGLFLSGLLVFATANEKAKRAR